MSLLSEVRTKAPVAFRLFFLDLDAASPSLPAFCLAQRLGEATSLLPLSLFFSAFHDTCKKLYLAIVYALACKKCMSQRKS